MEKTDIKRKIQIHDFCIIGNGIWFTVNACNKVFKYNIKKRDLSTVAKFPDVMLNKANLFSSVEYYNEKIFFTPFISDKVYIYNIKNNKFDLINLSMDENTVCKYCSCFADHNSLYLVPICAENILKINMDTYSSEYVWNINKRINTKNGNEVKVYFNNQSCRCGEYFVNFISETKIIVLFNTAKQKINIKRLDNGYQNIIAICSNGNNLYCLERGTGNIINWNIKSNTITYLNISYGDTDTNSLSEILDIRYQGSVYSVFRDNNIYMCPDLGSVCIKIDMKTKKAYTLIENTLQSLDNRYLNSKIHLIDEKVMFFYGAESSLVTVDKEDVIKKEDILMSEEEIRSLRKEIMEEVVMEEDSRICDLKLFAEMNLKKKRSSDLKNTGNRIFRMIKEEC